LRFQSESKIDSSVKISLTLFCSCALLKSINFLDLSSLKIIFFKLILKNQRADLIQIDLNNESKLISKGYFERNLVIVFLVSIVKLKKNTIFVS